MWANWRKGRRKPENLRFEVKMGTSRANISDEITILK